MDRKLLQYLVEYLVKESEAHGCALPPAAADAAHDDLASASADELWLAFRSLVNVRPPWPAPAEFLAAQNELLQGLIAEAGVATLADATPSPTDSRLRLWRGDITTLAVDAIVNAAKDAGLNMKKLAADVEANLNPAKWVCVEAEKTAVLVHNCTVLLVMSWSNVTDALTANFNALWS